MKSWIKNKGLIALLAVGLIVGLVFAGCARAPTPAPEKAVEWIQLGVFCPTSGPFSDVAFPWYGAALKAAEDVNREGGMKVGATSYFWATDVYNTEYAAGPTEVELRKFIAKGGHFVTGFIAVEEVVVAFGLNEANNVLVTAPVGAGYECTYAPNTLHVVCSVEPGPTHTKIGEYMAKVKGYKRVATIELDNDWGHDYGNAIALGVEQYGGQMVDREDLTPTDVDFSARITKIMASNPDIVCCIMGDGPGALFVKQLRELGYKGPLFIDGVWNETTWIQAGRENVDGALFFGVNPCFSDTEFREKVLELNEYFKTHYVYSYQYPWEQYDLVRATSWAIEEAQSIDAREVLEAFPAAVANHQGEFLTGMSECFLTPKQGAYLVFPISLCTVDPSRDPVTDFQLIRVPEAEYHNIRNEAYPDDPIFLK